MRPLWSCLLVLLSAVSVRAQAAEPTVPGVELRLRHGDDPRWAAPDFDDSDWMRIAPYDFPARAGIYWVRFRVSRPATPVAAQPYYSYVWPGDALDAPIDAVFLASVYSFDFYWDGRLLARSGRVGASRAEEVPGPLDHLVRIPDDLLGPGEHVIAFRISSHRYNFPAERFGQGFMFVNYARRVVVEAERPIFPLVGVGGCLLIALLSGVFYAALERRRTLLLCGALGLLLAAFYGLIAFRWLVNAPYPWHCPRLVVITLLMAVVSALVPWLLVEQFDGPRRRWLLVLPPLLVAAWLASPVYELKALWMCRAMLLVSLGLSAWAVWHRRTGAWAVLLGVLLALIGVRGDRRAFLDPSFFLIFGGLALFIFAAVGARLRADREQARKARLTAARLEIELLKKNLQPHFLLNTLTAISEVIERDPAGAVRFIDDLAGEFRSLAQMSGERLVPLRRELELCHAHLKVISRRTGRSRRLEVEGAADEALVPPALFLTLIENGLVHQEAAPGAPFRLQATAAPDGMRFVFLSPGRTRPREGRSEGGTGLRYVKARLEESFPGQWTFAQGAVAGGWETIVGWQPAPVPGGIA